MTVTHSLSAAGRTTQVRPSSTSGHHLDRWLRLLSREWRAASWMLTHSPLSLDETLNDPQFEEWLGGCVGTTAATTAINAVDDFATQSPETQQTLALLARYYLASRRPPAWATRHWRQPA